MVADTYTRIEHEDTRSLCERIGHDFREISSRVKRWHVNEEQEMDVIPDRANPDEYRASNTITVRTRTNYRAELVTYRCSRCNEREERQEDEEIESRE
jgi:hypothetical protein